MTYISLVRDSYLTIADKSESFYKEKGSKFLGFAIPVSTEGAVKEALAELRKSYYDARHHCYAYRLGHEGEVFRANDDGEPGHSAGDPILGQIKSRELTNTLVVVVRYFGGTKLGVSGLITAYKTAAAEALNANEIIEEEIRDRYQLSFPYDEMNTVMKLVKELDLKVIEQGFDKECLLDIGVLVSKTAMLEGKLDLLQKTGSSLQFEKLDSA